MAVGKPSRLLLTYVPKPPAVTAPASAKTVWSLASPAESKLFHQATLEELKTPEGRQKHAVLLRFPEDDIKDVEYAKTYLDNIGRAIHEKFVPAVKSGKMFTQYPQELRTQHRQLLSGAYAGYLGARPKHSGFGAPTPGTFLSESSHPLPPPALAHYREYRKPDEHYPPKNLEKFRRPDKQLRFEIEGVPEGAWPGIVTGVIPGLGSALVTGHTPTLLQRMGVLLEKAHHPATPLAQAVNALADYLYIGNLAHPFARGNMSLFTAHMNVMLNERGLPMVPLRDLDFRAVDLTQAEFRQLFTRYIEHAKTRPAVLKVPSAP